jgi:ABC-type proline/glycine betaine transport system permease subunit
MAALLQENLVPEIPLADWTNTVVGWINETFEPIFDPLNTVIEGGVGTLAFVLTAPPELVIIVALAAIAFLMAGWRIALFTVLGLLLVISLG